MILASTIDGPQGAPALVLLNSIGTTGQMWASCVGPLAEQFRVVRLDTRGHGHSPAVPAGQHTGVDDLGRDVLDTLDHLGVGRAHVAGLSLGGMTAMWLAVHHPQRVDRLGLLCTSPYLLPAQNWIERAVAVRTDGMTAVADVPARTWITSALGERDPALLAGLQAMLAGVDAESYAQCCEAIAQTDLRPDLARIAAPTLVIAGADDPATPPSMAEEFTDAIAGARLEVYGPAAHIATVEQPGPVVAALLGHLRGGASLAAGLRTRRDVLGDEHVDRSIATTTPLTKDFQQFITRYAWGDVWSRPELPRRERSIATLAALVALGAENEITMHVRAALRNGMTEREIAEVILHTALYAGLPRANRAFAILRETLESPDA